MENKMVIVEYRTRKEYCHCCDQKLPNPKTSDIREFEITPNSVVRWGGKEWKEASEYEDYLHDLTEQFVYDTISFFATGFNERILIEKSEFEKVKQFILNEVIA